jgi:hypothetical protein
MVNPLAPRRREELGHSLAEAVNPQSPPATFNARGVLTDLEEADLSRLTPKNLKRIKSKIKEQQNQRKTYPKDREAARKIRKIVNSQLRKRRRK